MNIGSYLSRELTQSLEETMNSGNEAASSTSSTNYDVFLSFRGEDTRNTFTDHLFHALDSAGLKTYRDNNDIEAGDAEPEVDLEAAIGQSKASVIVISENYAASSWCLNELVLILRHKMGHGSHIVLPIFYHVDRSRLKRFEYEVKDERDMHPNNINKRREEALKKRGDIWNRKLWEKAVKEVADFRGIVADHRKRDSEIIRKVVEDLADRLDRKASVTPPSIIGMEDRVREIYAWLENGSSNLTIDILTICGIAGIGKTTLAKYIYNSNVRGAVFDGRIFLADIGSRSILEVQNELLNNIRKGSTEEISDVNQGTNAIQEKLKTKKLLLVLDRVNDVKQLNSLLGKEGFFPGTKVIITTDGKSLPRESDVYKALIDIRSGYREIELEGLSKDASLELLCKHAFESRYPKKGYEELSRNVSDYCRGHPLALEVLGCSLYQYGRAVWEETLGKLDDKIVGPERIKKALQVGCELLEYPSDKELFKHIACFFVGEEKDYVQTIMNACGVHPSSGIPNLIDKYLLTIDPQSKRLMMHELIVEAGRDMVRQESLGQEPCTWSRLWCHDDSFDVLAQMKGTENIKGLILDMEMLNKKNLASSNRDELKTDAFRKMDNLELLKLSSVKLTGSYDAFPRSLKWLCWHRFPLESIPSELPMENLVALDLSHSKLKYLWNEQEPKCLGALKILNLSWCSELSKTPNFSLLPKLERLTLKGCTSLVEVDESIGNLDRLVFLDMSDCKSLKNLPTNFAKLKPRITVLLE